MDDPLEANIRISNEDIIKRAFNIKQVIYDNQIECLMFAENNDIAWGGQVNAEPSLDSANHLKEFKQYSFLHHGDITALSYPSFRELLSALPEQDVPHISALSLKSTGYDAIHRRHDFIIIAYSGTLPDHIKNQAVISEQKEFYPLFELNINLEKPVHVDMSKITILKKAPIRFG